METTRAVIILVGLCVSVNANPTELHEPWPEDMMALDSKTSICYGPGTHRQLKPNCPNNDEIIAVWDIRAGAKQTAEECPAAVQVWRGNIVDASNVSNPVDVDNCCFPDLENDCISSYRNEYSATEYYTSFSGYNEASKSMVASWIETPCNGSSYMANTNYMYMNISCIEQDRIGSLFSNDIFNTTGDPFYIYNNNYPDPMTSSNGSSQCEVRSSSASILVQTLDIRLTGNATDCPQTLNITDGSTSVSWNCTTAPMFNITQHKFGNKVIVTLTNELQGDGGQVWIGFHDPSSNPMQITCQSNISNPVSTPSTRTTTGSSTTTTTPPSTTGQISSSEEHTTGSSTTTTTPSTTGQISSSEEHTTGSSTTTTTPSTTGQISSSEEHTTVSSTTTTTPPSTTGQISSSEEHTTGSSTTTTTPSSISTTGTISTSKGHTTDSSGPVTSSTTTKTGPSTSTTDLVTSSQATASTSAVATSGSTDKNVSSESSSSSRLQTIVYVLVVVVIVVVLLYISIKCILLIVRQVKSCRTKETTGDDRRTGDTRLNENTGDDRRTEETSLKEIRNDDMSSNRSVEEHSLNPPGTTSYKIGSSTPELERRCPVRRSSDAINPDLTNVLTDSSVPLSTHRRDRSSSTYSISTRSSSKPSDDSGYSITSGVRSNFESSDSSGYLLVGCLSDRTKQDGTREKNTNSNLETSPDVDSTAVKSLYKEEKYRNENNTNRNLETTPDVDSTAVKSLYKEDKDRNENNTNSNLETTPDLDQTAVKSLYKEDKDRNETIAKYAQKYYLPNQLNGESFGRELGDYRAVKTDDEFYEFSSDAYESGIETFSRPRAARTGDDESDEEREQLGDKRSAKTDDAFKSDVGTHSRHREAWPEDQDVEPDTTEAHGDPTATGHKIVTRNVRRKRRRVRPVQVERRSKSASPKRKKKSPYKKKGTGPKK